MTEPATEREPMPMLKHVIGLGFLLCILVANYATTRFGMIPVGFGLLATAGTYLAGLSFILRDGLQDLAGRRVTLGVIVAGAALSYLVSDPFIALASGVAFLLSEVTDQAIYSPLRRRGYVRAAVASNVVGTLVDTLAFLWIAGFPILAGAPGQIVGKVTLTGFAVAVVAALRARRALAS